MKRGRLGLAAIAVAIAAAGMSPARAVPSDCARTSFANTNHGYLWCGYHWASWPILYTIDTPVPSGVMPGVSQSQYITAVRNAADTWNNAWTALNTGKTVAKPLAYTTSASAAVHVSWTTLPAKTPGQTSTTGTGKVIQAGSVFLNQTLTYGIANMTEQLIGQLMPATDGHACVAMLVNNYGHANCDWYDIQDVLTHEFGHVIGLEHPGDEQNTWLNKPTSLMVDDMNETMYAFVQPAETNKRDLYWGDIVGLSVVGDASN